MTASRLTQRTAAAFTCPLGKAEGFLWDADLRGFGIRASAGGSRRYVLQFRSPGERSTKKMSIGAVDAISLEEARREARKLLAQALTGTDPHAAKKAKGREVLTVGELADRYLEHCVTRQRESTQYQTRLHITKHWAPLHGLAVDKVTRRHVADQLTVLARSSGGVSANRSRAALSAMFSWGIGSGLAETNPVVGTLRQADEQPRERVLTEAELRAVWRACRDDAHGRIVKLLILTGQRREEVGGMADDEIDDEAAVWTLPVARSKNHRAHAVPLSPAAKTILDGAPRVEGRLSIFGEGAGGFSGWSRCKARLDERLREAGTPLPHWTLHDLRRTAATLMADRLDVAPHIIEAVLNHVSGVRAGVAGIYNRAEYSAGKRDALNRWAEHVLAIVAD